MKTSVERIDDTHVKLTITVEAERVGRAVDDAARKLAAEVRVPGFRPGRAPRRVLEHRLGRDTLLQEAAQEALPAFYADAVAAEGLAVVGPPELEVGTFLDGQDAEFSATVEVRPEFELPDYRGLQVPHPEWELTDEELQAQLDALRGRFAELETVSRPVQAGDYALITISATRDGQRVDEASAEDLLYPVGPAGEDGSSLDRNLTGAQAGAILRFTDALPADAGAAAGEEAQFTVIVKEVKVRRLPELDDDFALTASEFDTVAELREDVRRQLAAEKLRQARAALRGRVVEAVCERVEVPLPDSLVRQEVGFRLEQLRHQAEQHGMTLEQLLQAAGTSAQEALERFQAEAQQTVKARLVVDAVAESVGITVDEGDLSAEIGGQAARLGRSPEELAQFMSHPERIGALYSDVLRRKAIDHLLDSVQVLSAPLDEPATDDAEPSAGAQAGQGVGGDDAPAAAEEPGSAAPGGR